MSGDALHSRIGPPGLIIGAVIGAAIANIVQFHSIDREIGGIYDAISTYDQPDLAAIAQVHSPTVRERFGLALHVGSLAPGVTIDLGGIDELNPETLEALYGLGRAAAVIDHGPMPFHRRLDQIEADATVVVSGTDRGLGPYTMALGAEPASLRMLAMPDRVWVVDRELLEGSAAEAER